MKFLKKNIFIIVIVLFATILRLYGLSYNPPHLTSDEASLGYNAYSILKTGRDEHGAFLPITFESFGDWKPGLYIYLSVPFVALFGLNEFSVRLVGALSGILAIFLLYLIAKRLTNNFNLSLLTAFFLSLSPWHLQFSRGAWEANLALTLSMLGIFFFVRAIQDNGKYLLLSSIFFALTTWGYQGAKLSTLIIILTLIVIFWNEIKRIPKKTIGLSVLCAILVSTPILLSFVEGKTGRLEVYSLFSYKRSEEVIAEILRQGQETKQNITYTLFHSEGLNHLRGFLGRWFNHFSGRFLFFEGDWGSARHRVPNNGMMLVGDIILLIFGLVALVRSKASKIKTFTLILLILSPLPAALSRDSVHAVRSLSMVLPLSIVLSSGTIFAYGLLNRGKHKIIFVIFILSYFASFVYYLDQYWIHMPKQYSSDWHYGQKQLVLSVTQIQSKYPEIVIQQSYTQPYIFFLFYQKYDPKHYQNIANTVFVPSKFGDVGLVGKLDNITFREINWSEDRGASGKLFVADLNKIPINDSANEKEFGLVGEIKYLNNETKYRLVEIKW